MDLLASAYEEKASDNAGKHPVQSGRKGSSGNAHSHEHDQQGIEDYVEKPSAQVDVQGGPGFSNCYQEGLENAGNQAEGQKERQGISRPGNPPAAPRCFPGRSPVMASYSPQ